VDRTYRIHKKNDKYMNSTVMKSGRKRPFYRHEFKLIYKKKLVSIRTAYI